jgi:O-antigen/teichoic acid export membrane protein
MSTPSFPADERRDVDVLDSAEAGGMLIRGSAVRGVGYGAITLLSLVSAPLLTRHLGVIDFGHYTLIVSLVAIVGAVTEAGIGAYAVRELAARPPGERRQLMREILGLRLALTTVGVGFAVVFAAVAGYGSALVIGTVLAGIGLLCYVVHATLTLPLAAELRLGWVTASEVLRQVVLVGLFVALVVFGSSIVPLLSAPIGAGIAAALLVFWRVRDRVPLRPSANVRAWRRMLRETLPIAAAGAIYVIYFRVVLLLLSLVSDELQTGYYALSFRILEVLVAVPFLLVGSALPLLTRAARDDQERLRYAFQRIWEMGLIGGALLALVTAIGAPSAIAFLDPRAGPVPVDVLRIQACVLLAVSLNVAYAMALIALRRHRELIVVNLIVLVGTVVVALVLVPNFAARGAAVATTMGELSLVVAYAVALGRARPDLRPRLWVLPRVVAATAGAAVAAFSVNLPLVPNVASAAIAAVVFVAILAALRGLPPELLQAIRDRYRRR